MAAPLLVALVGAAEDFWKTKPAESWTVDEALKVVQHSPWAHEEVVANPRLMTRAGTGVTLGDTRRERVPYPAPRTPSGVPRPPRPPEPSPSEFVTATYLVRWESAAPVAQAFTRLEELGEHASAAFQSPPLRLPEDRYVVTVKTTEPPERGPEIFEGLNERQLRPRARLKTPRGTVAPLEVERSGLGANAAVHFFFPRIHQGAPLLRAQRETVVFRFENRRIVLTSKFRLEPAWVR